MALFAGLAVLSGCSTSSSDEGLPLTEQLDIIDELIEQNSATEQDVIAECMKLEGLDYVPPPSEPPVSDTGSYGIGVLTPTFDTDRPTYGWTTGSISLVSSFISGTSPNPLVSPNERIVYEQALYGSPNHDGCIQKGREAAGNYDRLFDLADRIHEAGLEITERLGADAASSAWIRCFAAESVIPNVASLDSPKRAIESGIGEIGGLGGITTDQARETRSTLYYSEVDNRFGSTDPEVQSQLDDAYALEERIVAADRKCAAESGLAEAAEIIREQVEAEALDGLN